DGSGAVVQALDALGHRHARPRPLERRTGRGHRRVDFGAAGFVHLRDDLAGDWRALVEGAHAVGEFAVDEVLDLFHGGLSHSRFSAARAASAMASSCYSLSP